MVLGVFVRLFSMSLPLGTGSSGTFVCVYEVFSFNAGG